VQCKMSQNLASSRATRSVKPPRYLSTFYIIRPFCQIKSKTSRNPFSRPVHCTRARPADVRRPGKKPRPAEIHASHRIRKFLSMRHGPTTTLAPHGTYNHVFIPDRYILSFRPVCRPLISLRSPLSFQPTFLSFSNLSIRIPCLCPSQVSSN
jgi:hypothetical protein